jgi:acetyltransferase-like isoleucine patch superfamily enzyme
MRFGIKKLLRKFQVYWNINEFNLRNRLLGFDNSNAFLRRLDKNSIIPILSRNGAIIGNNCDFESPIIFHNCQNYSNLVVSNNVHIGKNCFIDLKGKVVIEDNVVVSMQTTIITHQDLGKSELKSKYPASLKDVIVKSSSYIGANSTILQGVQIGENSLVAAGSVVTKNTLPYTIVAGVPAKFIKNIN